MDTFHDLYGNTIQLCLGKNVSFEIDPKHVFVLACYREQWLLTKHAQRGYEFPGGKVERGETPEQAAVREVAEETGGQVDQLAYIGQYCVKEKTGQIFYKNIYVATIGQLIPLAQYRETEGPVLMTQLPISLKKDRRFSFMMRDDVVPKAISFARDHAFL